MKKYKYISCWICGSFSWVLFVGLSLPFISFSGKRMFSAWQMMNPAYEDTYYIGYIILVVLSIIFAVGGSFFCFMIRKHKYANAAASACFFLVFLGSLISSICQNIGIGSLLVMQVFGTFSIALIVPFVAERIKTIES